MRISSHGQNMTEWLPLESAPKDGSKVLLLIKRGTSYSVEIGWFRDEITIRYGIAVVDRKEWIWGYDLTRLVGGYEAKPVSWQPLPEVPQ